MKNEDIHRGIDMFLRELDEIAVDVPEFVENNIQSIHELFETGSVCIVINGKEITISLKMKGF